MEIEKILSDVFKYDSFRKGQKLIIETILKGIDVFAIFPTGFGKSICFQIPAILFDGLTIVISPLISLMNDQVNRLTKIKINAVFLNRSITTGAQKKIMNDVLKGKFKIIYIAPERLNCESFINLLKKIKISLVVIDEAHCVLQWGHNFRPSYLKIGLIFNKLKPRPVFAAFTATIKLNMVNFTADLLNLKHPKIFNSGFMRSNLFFDVFYLDENRKIKTLIKFLNKTLNQSTIIYCQTRKIVDFLSSFLLIKGFKNNKYHAGLSQEVRRRNQRNFLNDEVKILVATNAFGLGIDKPNVRNIVHFNMPKNLEDYYQEAGRAGRDGLPARCLMFWNYSDIKINELLIEKTNYFEKLKPNQICKLKDQQILELNLMINYCKSETCYRNQILKYFDNKLNLKRNCLNCGNCLAKKNKSNNKFINILTQFFSKLF